MIEVSQFSIFTERDAPMKAILLAVALIAGLATVAAIVAPHMAYACDPSDPSCSP